MNSNETVFATLLVFVFILFFLGIFILISRKRLELIDIEQRIIEANKQYKSKEYEIEKKVAEDIFFQSIPLDTPSPIAKKNTERKSLLHKIYDFRYGPSSSSPQEKIPTFPPTYEDSVA